MKFSSLLAIIGLTLISVLSLPAQTVRVIFSSGEASLQRPDEPALRPVIKGETVIIGTRIVTGADGRVVLTPMPGVKSIIAPNSILLLESSSETRTSATEVTHQAVFDLKEGAIVSDLQKPEGVTYDYSIRTARGLAGARGTTFTVGINQFGIQTIVVAHGTITLNFIDGSSATLSLGKVAVTQPNGQTQSAGSVGELSKADQAIAQNWAEITILEIAAAVEAGIEVSPEALTNALATAASLGITLTPETQAAADKALATLETSKLQTQTETTTTETTDTTQITTQLLGLTGIDLFRSTLTPSQLAIFNTLPASLQQLLLSLNDAAITALALAPDRDTGLPVTNNRLSTFLSAYTALSTESRTFLKQLAGPDLQNFDNTPDPAAFSPQAFERTLVSWNLLSSTQRSQIIALAAGESIMDTSAAYIAALLDSLTSTQASLIQQTGWGDHLADLAGKPTSQQYFSALSGISAEGLAAIKFFDISPDVVFNSNLNLAQLAETLGGLSAANRETLRQLGVVDAILESFFFSPGAEALQPTEVVFQDYPARLAGALSFYNQLTSDEKIAARAIGLGAFLYNYAPGDSVNEGGTTALQLIRQLAKFYTDNPGLQQAIQETDLLSDSSFLYEPFDPEFARSALQAYNALPARTRNYLLVSDSDYSFFSIYQASLSSQQFNYGIVFRSFSQINNILSNLTAAEYGTLLDLDLSTAVFTAGDTFSESFTPYFQGSPLTVIKAAIANYAQLGTLQKFVLRELGIVGEGNVAILGADTEGLGLLLSAYGALPGTLRASTEQLNENSAYYSTYGGTGGPLRDRSFFFPRGYNPEHVIYEVKFASNRDLYVGATRYLRLYDFSNEIPTFAVGAGRDLYLYAANLIDLENTSFSAGIRGITMAAHTINLTNVNFPEGSRVSLNSKLGQVAFWNGFDSSRFNNGKVNFQNVSYGGNSLNQASDLASEFGANGNIRIGTLKNPAPRPLYTPTALPQ